MSLSNDIVNFWFWGYRGDWRIELQAPVVSPVNLGRVGLPLTQIFFFALS